MPFANEHAARVKSPGSFQEDSFRRKVLEGSGGVVAIIARPKGKTTTQVQALRFPVGKFSASEARKWLQEHKKDFPKVLEFEKATGENSSEGAREFVEVLEFSVGEGRVRREESGEIVIPGVKFLGNRSTNVNRDGSRNVYALEARRANLSQYDGMAIFVDHPDKRNAAKPRSMRDQVGLITKPAALEGGNFGELRLNPKHPQAESIAWLAEHRPGQLGLSHNASGMGHIDGKDCLLESWQSRSVDIVVKAATTKNLFEALHADDEEEDEDKKDEDKGGSEHNDLEDGAMLRMIVEEAVSRLNSLRFNDEEEDLKTKRAKALKVGMDLVDVLARTPEPAPLPPASGASVEDTEDAQEGAMPKLTKELLERVEKLETDKADTARHAARRKLLEAAKIRPGRVKLELIEQILDEPDDEKAKALIEGVKALVHHQDPRAGGRRTAAPASDEIKTVDDFVAATGR